MKTRTFEMLSDYLAKDLSWRKRELTDLKQLMQLASNATRRKSLLRACISMLYAHFEGFTKIAGSAYLEYIFFQRITNNKISKNFLALTLCDLTNKISHSKKASSYIHIVDFFLEQQNDKAYIPYKSAVNTESNLSSRVFKEVISNLGFDYSLYETKEKLIDCKLLGKRNHIAHGEDIYFDDIDYDELHDCVIGMMNCLRNQIENAVALKEYIRSA